MELLKRLIVEEEGQGLVEYALMLVTVAIIIWVAANYTGLGTAISTALSKVGSVLKQ